MVEVEIFVKSLMSDAIDALFKGLNEAKRQVEKDFVLV